MENNQTMLTVKELADLAKTSEQYIRQILVAGRIPGAVKIAYTWFVPKAAALRWLENRKAQ